MDSQKHLKRMLISMEMGILLKVVGVNVRLRREVREWLQRDLASKIGVTEATIKDLESGKGTRLINIERIAQIFDIEPYVLLIPKKEVE